MTRALTIEEEKRLIRIISERKHTERDLVIIRFPLETGLRLREVAGLNWQDVSSMHEDILNRFKLRPEIAKRQKSRIVELNRHIRMELEAYRKWYSREFHQTTGPLFISRIGRRLSPRQIERIADKWFQLAGIDGVTYHGLRHTFAVKVNRCSKYGVEAARRLLGHARLETTRLYVDHLGQEELSAAVDW